MQILIQVFCQSTTSLRKRITNDDELQDYNLVLTEFKQNARSKGWAKIAGIGYPGVINLEWDAKAYILYARVVSKGDRAPAYLIANFIEYLYAKYQSDIKTININPIG